MRAALVLTLAATCCSAAPTQIHLALGNSTSEMVAQWSDSNTSTSTQLCWRTSKARSTPRHCAGSAVYPFTQDTKRGVWYNHVATMRGLAPGEQKYYYEVDGRAEVFHFTTHGAAVSADKPQRVIVYGDMGTKCAFALCPGCTCGAVCDGDDDARAAAHAARAAAHAACAAASC